MPIERIIPTTRVATVVTTEIKVNGQRLPEQYLPDSISVYHEVNRVPLARIALIDGSTSEADFAASGSELFVPGAELEILLGYASDNHSVFKGILTRQSIKLRGQGSSATILECKHPVVKMTLGRKSKYYPDTADHEMMQQLLQSYGLDVEVEDTAPMEQQLVQYDCTDWDFLLSRAEAQGLICIPAKEKVSMKRPELDQDTVLTLVHGATIYELDLETDARLQQKEVEVASWNSNDQEMAQRSIDEPAAETGGNVSAMQLAEVAAPDAYQLKHGGHLSEPELQAWGEAFRTKSKLAKIRGTVQCKGTFEVQPGKVVELEGVGNVFSGKYLVSGIHHQVAGGDWRTTLQLGLNPDWFTGQFAVSSLPAGGLLPVVQGLQIGIVTQLEDPQARMRIKVKLPVVEAEAEGIWARLATLDAGNERGTFFLPEIGDEVIVGFLNDDPRDAVVLGALHSSAKPAPVSASDDNHVKGLVTRSQMQLMFDDDKKTMTLSTPAGKEMKLDETEGHISIKDEHGNRIELSEDGIIIESQGNIVIKATKDMSLEGLNIEAKASVNYKAEGSAGSEISSSGVTVVKGSIVQIN